VLRFCAFSVVGGNFGEDGVSCKVSPEVFPAIGTVNDWRFARIIHFEITGAGTDNIHRFTERKSIVFP